jgi:hypothetical protein
MKCNVEFAFKTDCSHNPLKRNNMQNYLSSTRFRTSLFKRRSDLFFCAGHHKKKIVVFVFPNLFSFHDFLILFSPFD